MGVSKRCVSSPGPLLPQSPKTTKKIEARYPFQQTRNYSQEEHFLQFVLLLPPLLLLLSSSLFFRK